MESSSTGPFTLFAPTDKGFDALPADVLDKLSKDKALLKKVLSYHVVSGKILAKDLKNNELLDSLDNPDKLRINIYGQVSFSLSNIYLDLRIQTMPWFVSLLLLLLWLWLMFKYDLWNNAIDDATVVL